MAEQLVSFLQRTPSPDTSLKRALASSVLFFGSLTSLNYFRLSFPNCKSCVYNCDDLLSFKKKFPFWPYNLESFIDQVCSIKMARLASSFFQYVKDLQVINAESNLDKVKTS